MFSFFRRKKKQETPAPEESLKGKIIDCVKKGYKLHDKVLRHSSVVVGQ